MSSRFIVRKLSGISPKHAAGPWTHDWKTQGKTSTHCFGTTVRRCVFGSTSVTLIELLNCGADRPGVDIEIRALMHLSGPPTSVGMSLHKSRLSPVWTASGKVTIVEFNAIAPIP
jgi:hypothetical protein